MRCRIVLSGMIFALALSGTALEPPESTGSAALLMGPACASPIPATPAGTAMSEMGAMAGMTMMEPSVVPSPPEMGMSQMPEGMGGMVMGSPEPPAACAIEVAVSEGEFFVRTAQQPFHIGLPYVFVVTNMGKSEHMFVIEPKGANHEPLMQGEAMAMVHGIAPGQTVRLPWTFREPGAYQLACHEPGHYEAGMVQSIAVTS